MKKYTFIIGGLLIAFALIVSVIQWNKEVDITTEKAKEDLTNLAKQDPQAAGKLPSANDQETTTNNQDIEQTQQKDSVSTTEPSSKHSNQNDSNTSNSDPVVIEQEGQQNSNSNRTPIREIDTPETEGKSLSEIKSAYQRMFSDLEIQQTSTLDQLIVQAKADFVSGKYSKSELVNKYGATATQIEKQADQSFNALYSQLQLDLSQYGHDQNEATEFRSEYNRKKQARLSHTISQLQGF